MHLVFRLLMLGLAFGETAARRSPKVPPRISEDYPLVVTATEGDQVELTCPVLEDKPSPIITWKKKGHEIHLENNHGLSDHSRRLAFRDAHLNNSGIYVCVAVNGFGSVNVAVELIVERKEFENRTSSTNPSSPLETSDITTSTSPPPGTSDTTEDVIVCSTPIRQMAELVTSVVPIVVCSCAIVVGIVVAIFVRRWKNMKPRVVSNNSHIYLENLNPRSAINVDQSHFWIWGEATSPNNPNVVCSSASQPTSPVYQIISPRRPLTDAEFINMILSKKQQARNPSESSAIYESIPCDSSATYESIV